MDGTGQREQEEYERRRAAIRAQRRKRNRQEVIVKMVLGGVCFAILAVTGTVVLRAVKGRGTQPVIEEVAVQKRIVKSPPEYEEELLSINEYSRPGSVLERVRGVVVHYTANPGTTAQQNRDYFEGLGQSGETYASSHFVIGIEGELIQCIPCQEIAYASNDRNEDTIAIECCISDETGKFSEATYNTLIHLAAWLMGRYDLEIDDIIRHYDITQKACPKYYVEYPSKWEELKKDIREYIDAYGIVEDSTTDAEEKELYQAEILPIQVELSGESYLDGVNLDVDAFYEKLAASNDFPKTSLPSLEEAKELVESYTTKGDEVLVITISSEISGTYQALRMLFEENPKVAVFDSRLAVGGVRFLVEEARKYETESLAVIQEKLNSLIPRIVIAAVPEKLDYLLAGGRLSRTEWMVGSLLSIKPVIGFGNGKVEVLTKKRGLKQSMQYIVDLLEAECDPSYGVIASYTHQRKNLDALIAMTDEKFQKQIKANDNLTPSIACHWGPNAFGYIFVKKNS